MAANTREERIEFTAIDKMSAVVNQINQNIGVLKSGYDTLKNALAAVGVTVGAGAMLKLYSDTLKANAAFADLKLETGASVESLARMQSIARAGGHDFGGFADQLGRMVKGLKSSNEEGQVASASLKFLGVAAKDANGNFRDTGEIAFDVAKALARYTDDGNKVALVQDALGKGAQRYLPLLDEMAKKSNEHADITGEQARQAKAFEDNLRELAKQFEDARRELVINFTPALLDFSEKLLAAKAAAGGLGAGIAAMLLTDTDNLPARLRELRAQLGAIEAARGAERDRSQVPSESLFPSGGPEALGRNIGRALSGVDESVLRNQIAFLEELARRRDAAAAKAGAGDPNSPLFQFPQPSGYQSPDRKQQDAEARLYTRSLQSLEEELGKANDLTKAEIVINRVSTGSWKDLTQEHKAYLIAVAGEYDDKQRHLALQKLFVESWENEARVLDAARNAQREQLEGERAERDEMQFQLALIGKTAREVELLSALRKVDLDTRSRLAGLPRDQAGEILPGAADAMAQIIGQAEQQKALLRGLIGERQAAERDWLTGAKSAFAEYAESAGNAAKNAHDFVVNGLQGMEDALVQFVKTGKLDFHSLADSIISDLIRIQIRQGITAPLAAYANTAISSGAASLFGFADGGVMTAAGPLPLRRYAGGGIASGPQLAMFGEGAQNEAFVPLPDGRSIPVQMRGGGGDTYVIDARGADRSGLARLEAMIQSVNGSLESRAVSALQRRLARRGYNLPV